MTTEHGIQSGHTFGHLDIHVHAVMRQQYHCIRFFIATDGFDQIGHIAFTQAKRPVREKLLRIGVSGTWKGLSHHSDACTADFLDYIRAESMAGVFIIQPATIIFFHHLRILVTEQGFLFDAHVLADKVTLKQCDVTQHFVFTIGEFPVTDHDVQSQNIGGFHHVDAARPQRCAGTLPQVTAVQCQRILASASLLTQHIEQGFNLRITTGFAVLFGRLQEIQIGIGIRFGAIRIESHLLHQFVADDMWRSAVGVTDAQIDIGLTEINRQ